MIYTAIEDQWSIEPLLNGDFKVVYKKVPVDNKEKDAQQ